MQAERDAEIQEVRKILDQIESLRASKNDLSFPQEWLRENQKI